MRSLNSFGVAGLIAENGEVFYTNDLRVRNAGRVSDLISAQIRHLEVDELKIRSVLVYGLFEAYALRGLPNRHAEEVTPASIEVGVDQSYVAIALSFHWERDRPPQWEGLADRIRSGEYRDSFEKTLGWIQDHSTQVLVRYETKERRIEIVSLLNRQNDALKDPFELISVEMDRMPLLEVGKYSELGDLNYADALKSPETDKVVAGEKPEEETSERRFSSGGEILDQTPVVVKDPGSEPEKEGGEWGLQFLKQVWPFASREPEPETKIEGGKTSESEEEVKVFSADAAAEESVEVLSTVEALNELEEMAKPKGSEVFEKIGEEIAASVEAEKAKRWIESLSSELLQEKARLNELQKTLSKQLRQKELEFKAAERTLRQELKQSNDLLKQRETAIFSKNEQIAQLNLAVERAGAASNDKEQKEMKVRLERAQMLAQMKEEESKTLVGKVRDLENRLIIAQAKAQKGNDLQMQTKVQTLEKKVEEYKRVNSRLMESMNQQKDKSGDKDVADLRRKLEQLDRQVIESKRSLDKANFRIREMQEAEKKLQTDLSRAVEENKALRKGQARGGGDSSGGQAA